MYKKLIDAMTIGADKTIGTQYISVKPDEVIAELPVTEKLVQPAGLLHGGVSVLLAESVASVASLVHHLHRNGYKTP